jgi:hypothetical protein
MTDVFAKGILILLWLAFAAGILWILSRGWRELAKEYRAIDSFSGMRWYFRTGAIAGSEYGCLLILGGGLRGAYVSSFLPSRFCPPLFIPWEDIQGIERKGVLVRFVELRFAKAQEVQNKDTRISGRMADRFEEVSNGRWKFRRAGKVNAGN